MATIKIKKNFLQPIEPSAQSHKSTENFPIERILVLNHDDERNSLPHRLESPSHNSRVLRIRKQRVYKPISRRRAPLTPLLFRTYTADARTRRGASRVKGGPSASARACVCVCVSVSVHLSLTIQLGDPTRRSASDCAYIHTLAGPVSVSL